MRKNLRFIVAILLSGILASCGVLDVFYDKLPDGAGTFDSTALNNFEQNMIEESENPPDFSAPVVVDNDLVVEGLDVVWKTSKPKMLGSKHAKQGGVFFSYVSEFPSTFRRCGPNTDHVSRELFETQLSLLDVSLQDYAFMPSAATHWAFDADGKTVYYKLNENALWSDGEKCTADDFVFAFDFFRSKKIVDPWVNEEYSKLTVKKINDYCISVTYNIDGVFTEPELLYLTNMSPVAKHFYGGKVPDNWPVEYNYVAEPTTGPYMLKSFDRNNGLVFEKVKNWWGYDYEHYKGLANFERINYIIVVGTTSQAMKYLKSAQIDSMYVNDSNDWFKILREPIVQDGAVSVWSGHYQHLQGMSGFFFNTRRKPLDDIRVRKAISYALNIDGALDTAFGVDLNRLQNLGRSQIISGIPFNDPTIKPPEFDIAKANALLDEAGYTNFDRKGIRYNAEGKKLEIEILYASGLPKDVLGLLNSYAGEAGIDLKYKHMKGGALERVIDGNFQIWFGELSTSRMPNHYYDFHSSFAETNDLRNIFGVQDSELDKLLEKYNNFDGSIVKLAEMNMEIERAVSKLNVFLPAFYSDTQRLIAWKWICFPGWLNRKHERFFANPMFGYMWFDEDIYKDVKASRENQMRLKMSIWNLSERNVLSIKEDE